MPVARAVRDGAVDLSTCGALGLDDQLLDRGPSSFAIDGNNVLADLLSSVEVRTEFLVEQGARGHNQLDERNRPII